MPLWFIWPYLLGHRGRLDTRTHTDWYLEPQISWRELGAVRQVESVVRCAHTSGRHACFRTPYAHSHAADVLIAPQIRQPEHFLIATIATEAERRLIEGGETDARNRKPKTEEASARSR
jgi:hypothetical protein